MKAACQADTCILKSVILSLVREHALQLDQILDVGLWKDQRGINNEATACLFLPYKHVDSYLADSKEWVYFLAILKSDLSTCLS